MLEPERKGLPALEHVVVVRGKAPHHATAWPDFLGRGQSVHEEEVDARVAAVNPDDVSDILFTSGTTGRPKGAMCTHAQALRAYADWADVVGLRAGDRYLIVNPFFHAFGYKAGIVAALVTGATILPHAVFEAAAVFERIPADRISMLPAPPALYQTLLNHPDLDKHDMSSLRLAVTGAAVIPVELVEKMRGVLGFETVITGYGLTEACGIATMCRHDDDPETIAATSGRAIPSTPTSSSPGAASAWPTSRCHAAWRWSTPCRSTPPARCSSSSCATSSHSSPNEAAALMDLRFSDEDEAFRREVRGWLEAN